MARVRILQFNGVLDKFVKNASRAMMVEFWACLTELKEHGHEAGPPGVKRLKSGIWELRPTVRSQKERATLLYGFHQGRAVFLLFFYKALGDPDPTSQYLPTAVKLLQRVKRGEAIRIWTTSPTLN